MIEHPERIIRQTKFLTYTEQEITIMRGRVTEGLRWLARDDDGSLYAYNKKPESNGYTFAVESPAFFGTLNFNLFPQITFENSPVDMEEELNRMDKVQKERE